MSSKPVRDAFTAYLAANWATTPIVAVLNEFPTPPSLSPWVALQWVTGAEEQISLGPAGGRLFRETGVCFVHVIVPAGTGANLALTYAETLRNLLRCAEFGNVRCQEADPPNSEAGATVLSDDGAWFGVSFGVDYDYDVTA